ncbi:hypothetical protein BIZ82_gp016 [Erwinia phage vB_EamM_EarlPhillipIV]|nr:hypothetical protein BIZ82_gp016 [Erwinia phage vB_EamM_EarlPhillipIV]ANZ48866.1 hypothetical protein EARLPHILLIPIV_16 [Erwinia phage vB_EamM_EarlPhillipIV]QXO09737.1 hypothetical protein pEaSNUABM38_00015 [Erwinia phage pEa_SNUABM_38]
MSKYNIVIVGPVYQDHGIIDYLQDSEPFMELMENWQRQLQVCLVNLSKENLEAIVPGEGEFYEELASRISNSILQQYNFVVPLDIRIRLHDFMKTVSDEYRAWEFDQGISSDVREDDYTEGLRIIHGLHKNSAGHAEDAGLLSVYFADRVARGVAQSIHEGYKDPLAFFMKRHQKDFKGGLMRLTFSDKSRLVKFQLSLTMED